MLPELILREEQEENFILLILLGLLSGITGFAAALFLFPTKADILGVIFAAIPLIFPLTSFFLERENHSRPHTPEIMVYGSVFLGEVIAFFLLGLYLPLHFGIQNQIIGATGNAVVRTAFTAILANNIFVFAGILATAAIIGSSGSFILVWNASVLGIFLSSIFKETPVKTLAYFPHASLEMTGFIIAGISGTMISAAVYREHFERETWEDLLKLVLLGVAFIVIAAAIETA